jgi:phosphoglycerate dehydrogenase-like enzyme
MTKPMVLVDPWPRRRKMIFTDDQWARLEAMADVVSSDGNAPMAAATVDGALARVTAILGQTDLPAERIVRAPQLRGIINVEGNFFPNVDYEACFARGIEVLCIAPVFALPVAEMALGLALDLARGITAGDLAFREGREHYGLAGNADAFLLSGTTLGIVGFGNLGRALRGLLDGFRARVLVHDPWLPASAIRDEGCEPVDLETLLDEARVIFLVAAATKDNQGFIGRRELARIRPGSVVILVSRTATVDFDALLELAASGRLRVATDVFPQEPVPSDHKLRKIDGLLLSSHRAGGIPQAFRDMGERILDDLDLIFRGLPSARLQSARRQTVSLMNSKPGRTYSEREAKRPPQ